MKSLISDRRIYLTAGGHPVEETHKQRATLLVGQGGTLRGDLAEKHNITLTDGRLTLPEAPEDDDEDDEDDGEVIPAITGPERVQAFLATLTPYQRRALLTHFEIEDKFGSPSDGELSYDAQIALLIHFLITEQGKFGEEDIAFLESINTLEDPAIDNKVDHASPIDNATDTTDDQDQNDQDQNDQEQQETPAVTDQTPSTNASDAAEMATGEKAIDAAPEDKAVKAAPKTKSLKGALQTKSEGGSN